MCFATAASPSFLSLLARPSPCILCPLFSPISAASTSADAFASLPVNIKWGKELFKDVEVNLSGTAADFRQQLFSLTNVEPENQKGTYSDVYCR